MRYKVHLLSFFCFFTFNAFAAIAPVENIITFDDAISGETTHIFDADGDGIEDVTFRTDDPLGFNTAGPGPNQLFVIEPGLEGSTGFTPDLRVDFLSGAVGSVGFGFATVAPTTGVFQVFDQNNVQLGATAFAGDFFLLSSDPENPTPAGPNDDFELTSTFPEGRVDLAFADIAAYAIIDFDDEGEFEATRYIIDNFTYFSAETEVVIIGTQPDDPVLPDPFDPENPEFQFELAILEEGLGTDFPIFIDPEIAIGYNYTINSGPNVTEVLIPSILPNGDGDFIIVIDGIEYVITAGNPFIIATMAGIIGGVSEFSIKDISTAEALDPTDSLAFVTGLTFASAGMVNLTQTPITFNTDASVPEPSAIILISFGIMGLFVKGRRNKA